ncbi:hypothetical protein OJF2_43180 [Aquisphaera giovannonii]|uniref:Uncharacterized protein n=1 Tax=Aquisphaera giovannonii TaxID=406548 RepID=A0A5B9W6Y1_9BACT|nr:hypothetical protein [Aquisphaera giovannonii]QEH35761.1 hypothetical protein OJF2_43180 [Aquisphaera giovannonii]
MPDQADNLRRLVRAQRQWKRADEPARPVAAGEPSGRPGATGRREGWLARAARRAFGLAT